MGWLKKGISLIGVSLSIVLALSENTTQAAVTGMVLVTAGTNNAEDLRKGNIVRIDINNSAVVNTTSSTSGALGNGTNPRFSPDGTKYCFLSNGGYDKIQIRNINGGLIREFDATGSHGQGQVCSWTNTGIWVSYSGTFKKFDTLGTALGTYTTATYVERAMISKSENLIGTVYINGSTWKPRIYTFGTGTSLNQIIPTITGNGCSVCPNPSGTLLTNNLAENPANDGEHRCMRILNANGSMNTSYGTNGYMYLKDIYTPANSNSNYRSDMQTWSGNSDEWVLLPVGTGGSIPSDFCSPVLYKITTPHETIVAKDNSGTSNHWQPFDFFVGPLPSTNPSLQISPTALTFTADSGSSNPTSQNIAATTSIGSLSGLVVSGANAGGWLTATAGGASGANITITNSISITGRVPGTYKDTINVTTTNAGNASYIVTLTITRPIVVQTLTSVAITPEKYSIVPNASVNYNVTCKDQSGNLMTKGQVGSTLAVTWAVSGGGTINSNGRLTANAAPSNGPHKVIVTVTNGSVTKKDTSLLMVTRINKASIHMKIDAGTDSYLPSGWQTDNAFISTGTDWNNSTTIDTTGVLGVAPSNVYKSTRRSTSPTTHSYLVPSEANIAYAVRLHFIDPQATTRSMSYSISGTNILNGFTVSTLAGAANKALALDFQCATTNANGIPITCSASSGDVFEAGFEVMEEKIQYATLISPQGGSSQVFRIGDVVPIRFVTDTTYMPQMYIYLSVNDGLSWGLVDSLLMSNYGSNWGTYNWTIPDSLRFGTQKGSTISTNCSIKIKPYSNHPASIDISDSSFTISARTTNLSSSKHPLNTENLSYALTGKGLTIAIASPGINILDVFSMSGQLIYSSIGTGNRNLIVPLSQLRGVVAIRLISNGKSRILKAIVAGGQ